MAIVGSLSRTLSVRAGHRARHNIRKAGGLDPAHIRMMVGASGGPKWLVLAHLDRVIMQRWIMGRSEPLDLLASSIGTWRFACYAQPDPLAALDRLEEAYLAYRYQPGDSAADISRDSYAILDHLLGDDGAEKALAGPVHLSIMAVRGRHILNSDHKIPLGAGLMAAALGNLISRKSLGLFFERALFADPRSSGQFTDWTGFPINNIVLTPDNFRQAIMASCSIPMVLNAVRDIAGAPAGLYRDGGIIDYHFDLPFLENDPDGIVLYPHFYEYVVPGWFDKPLVWRRRRAVNMENVLLIAPGAEFIAGLPFGKIPDRKDFEHLGTDERLAYWRRVLDETRRVADAFDTCIERGLLPDLIQPL